MECKTYRYYGHTVFDDPLTYRTKEEEDYYKSRDPLKLFREKVLPEGEISQSELDSIDTDCLNLMEEAVEFADSSPMPEVSDLYVDVYSDYPISMMKRGTNMSI